MLYESVEVNESTPVIFAAVHVVKWQASWGRPAILFKEADPRELWAAENVRRLLTACKHARAYLHNLADRDSDNWHLAHWTEVEKELSTLIKEGESCE